MQITFDPRELTQGQLEALAGFLLNFTGTFLANGDALIDKAAPVPMKIMETWGVRSENISNDISAAENIVSDIPSAEEAFGDTRRDDGNEPEYVPYNHLADGTTAVTVPVINPHLDKNGLPWDDRIHSGSRARNADGSWRYKRGVADTWVVEVEKELRNLMAIPAPSDNRPTAQENRPIPPPPSLEVLLTNAKPATVAEIELQREGMSHYTPGERQAVTIPPVPAVPAVPSPVPLASPVSSSPSVPPPPPPAASSEGPFVTLVKKVGALIPAGKLTQEEAKAACMAVGVNELYLLSNRHDLCPAVDAAIDAIVAGR